MSHLAPGGYVCLYIAIFTLILFWLLFPSVVEPFVFSLNQVNGGVLAVGFTVFVVICYFVGVVLRLPSVDNIDAVSIQLRVRAELKKLKPDLPSGRPLRHWFRLAGPDAVLWEDVKDSLSPAPSDEWMKSTALPKEFHKAVRYIAARNLEAVVKNGKWPRQANAIEAFRNRPDTTFVMKWLWMVDAFPYPLMSTYRALLRTTDTRRRQFGETLWDVMLAAMRGQISLDEFSKDAFNFCKSVIRKQSPRLAEGVFDDEALIRMMVGFYCGLWIASRGSAALAAIAVIPLWGYQMLAEFAQWAPFPQHTPEIIGMTALFLILSLAFNTAVIRQIVWNFHKLRMSEARLVFDSYSIVLSDCEKTGRVNPSSKQKQPQTSIK